MTPAQKIQVIEAMSQIVPLPSADCASCDPNGGCPNPDECRADLCLMLLDMIEREMGGPIVAGAVA